MKICRQCGKKFNSAGWKCALCGFEPAVQKGFFLLNPLPARFEEGFDVADFNKLFTLENSNFWFRSRNQLIFWALEKYFTNCSKFLEIGCGTGFVLSGIAGKFPKISVTGSDIYIEGLSYAASRVTTAQLFQMDATAIPFWEEFDVIGAFDVLEHIENDSQVLNEMWKAVKCGGGIILTVPQHPVLWSESDVHARHQRRYTKRDLQIKMEKAGFGVIRLTSFVTFPFPIMLFSRLLNKRNADRYDPGREFKISRPVNKLLEAILSAERYLIKAGLSFPFGGSLLAVARKGQTDHDNTF